MLSQFGISSVFHCTPLHYAPFILRARMLLSRCALERQGFKEQHFRSTSSRTDKKRGFHNYVFCSTQSQFPLLEAKLKRGFPHYLVEIPASLVERSGYLLCRRNIAKSRAVRGGKKAPRLDPACEDYGCFSLPVASTLIQKEAMLRKWWYRPHCAREVLIEGQIELTSNVRLIVFSEEDRGELKRVARQVGVEPPIVLGNHSYQRCALYTKAVEEVIEGVLANPQWRDYKLDFDSSSKR